MVETVGDTSAPCRVWFLHGVLGQGRNWRSFARRAVQAHPTFQAVLPDLRNHGAHMARSGPHTLAATARDLEQLAREVGTPDVLVGHSLGGKVALRWLEHGLPEHVSVVVLDAPPGIDHQPMDIDPANIVELLRGSPVPASSRDPIRAHLREAGLPESLVMWLSTSLERDGDQWHWVYDLDGVAEMLEDYRRTDLWSVADDPRVHLVNAALGGRWSPAELARAEASSASLHTLANAGHWLHVDDPEGTLAIVEERLRDCPPPRDR